MSDSYTSSDEEFESADEGDEELPINITPSATQVTEKSSAAPLSENVEIVNFAEEEEKCASPPPAIQAVENEEESIKQTVPDVERIEENVKTLEITETLSQSKTEAAEVNEDEKGDSIPINAPSDDNQAKIEPVKPRNVGRAPSRTKPSLGAKKLGAVKLSEVNTFSTQQEPTHMAKESNELFIEETSSLSKSSTAPQESSESNSWGWFAPPKLLSSVTSITTQILSTVENGLNIPEPEELAKEDLVIDEAIESEKKAVTEPTNTSENKGLGFGLFGLTKLVETTSTSLFATGLDTLETIGKKTIDVLQQTDPGFKKTKAALANPLVPQEKVCLSQILREAKDNNETKVKEQTPSTPATQTKSLSSLIELHYGTSHMEALQMLSQQWNTRVTTQARRLTTQRRVVFEDVAKICSESVDFDDEDCDPDDFDSQQLEQTLTSLLDRVPLIVPSQKLIDAIIEGMLDDDTEEDAYTHALDSLALVTSRVIELLRKSAELLLMLPKPSAGGAKLEAETLSQIASLLTKEIIRLGNRHANLSIKDEATNGKHSSTDLFYECANCRSLVQDALKLLIPVIQSRVI